MEATYNVNVGGGEVVIMTGNPDKLDVIIKQMQAAGSPAPDLADILKLAAKLPSGLDDPKAAEKLVVERDELLVALAAGDLEGALTEWADAVYYAAKHLDWASCRISELLGRPVTVEDALRVAVAKYTLRAVPGNPKDDRAERAACLVAMSVDFSQGERGKFYEEGAELVLPETPQDIFVHFSPEANGWELTLNDKVFEMIFNSEDQAGRFGEATFEANEAPWKEIDMSDCSAWIEEGDLYRWCPRDESAPLSMRKVVRVQCFCSDVPELGWEEVENINMLIHATQEVCHEFRGLQGVTNRPW